MAAEGSGSVSTPQWSCPVCLRSIAVTNAGLIRQHGPVASRCPGSRRPPSLLASAPTAVLQPPHQQPPAAESQVEHLSPVPVLPPRPSGKAIKHLPKVSREYAAGKFAAILGAVVDKNDHTSWVRLLRFSSRCLRHPERGGGRQSLASAVNRQLKEEVDPPPTVSLSPATKRPLLGDPDAQLAARVSAKLEEGDFKGAVRLASSEDTLAPLNVATLEALKGKHPPPHPDSIIPSADQTSQHLTISGEDITQAILSFPKSSAGGPDGLRPHHLKDIVHQGINFHLYYKLALEYTA